MVKLFYLILTLALFTFAKCPTKDEISLFLKKESITSDQIIAFTSGGSDEIYSKLQKSIFEKNFPIGPESCKNTDLKDLGQCDAKAYKSGEWFNRECGTIYCTKSLQSVFFDKKNPKFSDATASCCNCAAVKQIHTFYSVAHSITAKIYIAGKYSMYCESGKIDGSVTEYFVIGINCLEEKSECDPKKECCEGKGKCCNPDLECCEEDKGGAHCGGADGVGG